MEWGYFSRFLFFPGGNVTAGLSEAKLRRISGNHSSIENAMLAAIVECSDDAIIGKTLDGVITTWNAAAQRMFGYSAGEAIGQHMSMLLPPDRLDEEEGILTQLRKGKRVDHFETVRLSKAGKEIHVSVTSSPIRNSEGEIVGASKIARDISAQKRADAAIRWQQSAMEHMARLNTMGEMAAGLAHEINQPLSSVLTYAGVSLDMARSEQGSLKQIATALENVFSETQRAGEIIRRLRDFIHKREPSRELVNVNELIQDSVHLLQHDLRQAEITVHMKLASHLPGVSADRVQLVQVLVNLVRNARDAMIDPGATGRELIIASSAQGNELKIEVIDRGCGLTSDQMNRLFDRFFSTKATGLGMGLAISKTIIDSLDGRLTGTRNEGNAGMNFSISLPIQNQETL
jgi:PAS domain S-box-containing protein